ncbi:Hpt domain-containing protein [Vibrio sp. SCSIO 43136]|uniref:Hpt domain-containing protein n=1 Tax=Vibrio sp. SCSIO 43136 TaxID=2819101 RepID=UPI002075EE1A|nr:Hpt domain-containing protein [Vibrio sp. SCSIO 43136]USD66112.1 Hpt domain-containing protein [Vibrio sp. SCSIO 43136]
MTRVVNTDRISELANDIGEENLPMLFNIFIGELMDYAEALANAPSEQLQAEDQLKSISHSLKSSAASFGAEQLCDFATNLDARYKTGEVISTNENRQTMIEYLNTTREEYLKLSQ